MKNRKFLTVSDIFRNFNKESPILTADGIAHPKFKTLEEYFYRIFLNEVSWSSYDEYESGSDKSSIGYIRKENLLKSIEYKVKYYSIIEKQNNIKVFYNEEYLKEKRERCLKEAESRYRYLEYKNTIFIYKNSRTTVDNEEILKTLQAIDPKITEYRYENGGNDRGYHVPFKTLFKQNSYQIQEDEDWIRGVIWYNEEFFEKVKEILDCQDLPFASQYTERKSSYTYDQSKEDEYVEFNLLKDVYDLIKKQSISIVVDDCLKYETDNG